MTTQAQPLPFSRAPYPQAQRRPRQRRSYYFYALLILMAAYAVGGRFTAYLGIPPLYVGEIWLFFGCVSLAIGLRRQRARKIFMNPCSALLILFMILGALRTFPYVSEYGINAFRDGVVWIYGAFAFIMGSLLLRNEANFGGILIQLRRFSKFYIAVAPLLWAYISFFEQRMPLVLQGKSPRSEEVLLWLSAITALVFSRIFNFSAFWLVLLCIDATLFVPTNRAGFLAYLCVVAMCWLANPISRKFWLLAGSASLIVVIMALLNVHISFGRRELSVTQLSTDLASVFDSQSRDTDEQSTKKWRIEWWTKIVNYTIFGEYFWEGKGFGVNLATDDHFQVDTLHQSVRSPHSGHMGILAREGVPGFALWIAVNLFWLFAMTRRFLHAKIRGRRHWSALMLVVIAFWVASTIIISFGVELEGPMVGIPFWCNYGIGLAIIYIYRRRPYLLDPPPARAMPPMAFPTRIQHETGVQLRRS
jgi:O-Antigen ligase